MYQYLTVLHAGSLQSPPDRTGVSDRLSQVAGMAVGGGDCALAPNDIALTVHVEGRANSIVLSQRGVLLASTPSTQPLHHTRVPLHRRDERRGTKVR